MRAHLEGHGLRLCKVRSPSLHKQEGPSWGVEVGTTSRKAGASLVGRWDPSRERVVWSVDSASMEGVERPESQGVRGQSKQAVQWEHLGEDPPIGH